MRGVLYQLAERRHGFLLGLDAVGEMIDDSIL